MTKYFLLLSVLFLGLSSCKKDSFNAAKQAATDDALIKTYIAQNNITAIKDPSGVYYQVLTPGTGAYPTVNSNVTVSYEGQLLDGTVFSPTSSLTSSLVSLIAGWQYGIPHINAGGKILLIIPSGLGYGNTSPGGGIPNNAVLVFTIQLQSFTN